MSSRAGSGCQEVTAHARTRVTYQLIPKTREYLRPGYARTRVQGNEYTRARTSDPVWKLPDRTRELPDPVQELPDRARMLPDPVRELPDRRAPSRSLSALSSAASRPRNAQPPHRDDEEDDAGRNGGNGNKGDDGERRRQRRRRRPPTPATA